MATFEVGYWTLADGSGAATVKNSTLEGTFPVILHTMTGVVWCFYISAASALTRCASLDAGATWETPVTISASVTAAALAASELATGRIFVLYQKEIAAVVQDCRAWSDDAGATWTTDQVVT